jgi:SAM-dependent methyltransferase
MLNGSSMATLQPVGPNAEQIEYWNEVAGPKWVALQGLIDDQIRALGVRTIDRAQIARGERVVDVGCGCGDTTLEIARRVGPTGAVVGVDLSAVMLERAGQAARDAGIAHAQFENADAQTHAFRPDSFDVLYSRFGIMFFADPDAAFANLHAALRPGGRLAFVCWQTVQHNPWMLVPMMAALQHIPPPPMPAPDAPGPFAFADAERVRGILTRTGFADVAFEDLREVVTLGGGGDLDETVDFLLQMGPAARALRDVEAATRTVVAGAVRESLVPFYTPEDGVRMPSAAWVVTAKK